MITTPAGEKAISELEIGEKVLSLDTETNEIVESEVEELYSRTAPGYYKITLEAEDGTESVLKVTGEHPLLVQETTPTVLRTLTDLLSNLKNWFNNL
jgi:hypothetical protein